MIDEIAMVIVGGEFNRDIVLHRRNSDLQRVSETRRPYDALPFIYLYH